MEIEGEIIKETDKSYLIRKPDGREVYVCKICGEEFENVAKLAQHFSREHKKSKKKKKEEPDEIFDEIPNELVIEDTKEDDDEVVEEPKSKRRDIRILTPEEEMLEEMCRVLREEMSITPGIAGSNKIEWFINYFRKVKKLQEDPVALFNALKRHFPKADDEAIDLIVKSVFEVKESYERSLRYYSNGYERRHILTREPDEKDKKHSSLEDIMSEVLKVLLLKAIKDNDKKGPDPQTVALLTELKMKTEILEKQLLEEREEKKRLIELLSKMDNKPRVIGEGWSDDYARLIAELSNRMFDLTERIIIENKKTRQMLLKYVVPKLIENRMEPQGSGETSEEIIENIPKDLLEEE